MFDCGGGISPDDPLARAVGEGAGQGDDDAMIARAVAVEGVAVPPGFPKRCPGSDQVAGQGARAEAVQAPPGVGGEPSMAVPLPEPQDVSEESQKCRLLEIEMCYIDIGVLSNTV